MEYKGFECYASEVPEELSENGAAKVFACEIYSVEDTGMANVLKVFDLVEGKDIPVGSDEVLIAALQGYVDEHYNELSVLKLFNELAKLQAQPEYQAASVMAYLEKNCNPDEPFSDEELYLLSEKFVEASGSWFQSTASQQEYLIAFADLLECGITTHNNPEFSELGPIETRRLFISADNMVFGTLVESAAVENCYRYLPNDYQVDKTCLDAVEKAIENVCGLVGNVWELIDTAGKKAEMIGSSKDVDFEKEIG